jgi:hypothetical protein
MKNNNKNFIPDCDNGFDFSINDTSQYMLVSGALGHERFPRKQERGGTWNTSEFQI